MGIEISPELESEIRKLVETGLYGNSPEEVIRTGLRKMESPLLLSEEESGCIREAIRVGIESAENEPMSSLEDFKQEFSRWREEQTRNRDIAG